MTTSAPIYLDNAATTRVSGEVCERVVACMAEDYGNPSSVHHLGVSAERRVKVAQAALAAAIGDPGGAGRIVWTSGGTESNALGIIGAARSAGRRRPGIFYSAIEHAAVRRSARLLSEEGFGPRALPVTRAGVVDPAAVLEALAAVDGEAAVLAVMLVNNEIGTIQPVAELAAAVKAAHPRVHIHCDAVQALGKVPVDVSALGCDSVALAAHKLHGPKGVGALWLRKGARIAPLWSGGGQQAGLRSGTLNVPGIAGMGMAAERAVVALAEHRARWTELAAIVRRAAREVGGHEHGTGAARAPHIVSFGFAGVPAEPLLHVLESRGVLVSAGSACSERSKKPSAVLEAIGVARDVGTIRFSFGAFTTSEEVERAAEILVDAVTDFR